jgi:hypothetical protein
MMNGMQVMVGIAIRHVILFHNQTGKTEKISALVI